MRTCFGVGEPNDPQFTISAAHCHAVCYSIEGHTIDRKSSQNGKGWAEGYAHTLNATDRHGVCYTAEQEENKPKAVVYDGTTVTSPKNWNNPKFGDPCYSLHTDSRNYVVVCFEPKSALDENWAASSVKNALRAEASKSSHCVVFQQNQRDEVRIMSENTGALTAEPGMHNQNYLCYPNKARTITARHDSSPCVDRGQNVVCYKPAANFCGTYAETDKSATLETKYHFGGGGDAALMVYDARGNGDGQTVPNLTGDHENRVTDYTAICVEEKR